MIKEYKEQGMSIRAIARKLGHCPKTIRKYLKMDGDMPNRKARPSSGSKVDPYLPYLAKVLSEDHEIPSTVLFEQIRVMGYEGSLRRVQEVIGRHDLRSRARNEEELIRFETAPGRQLQVDWIEFPKQGLSAFVATLGYSRMSYVEYVTDEKLETLIACHVNAFAFFGGVPHEVLYDNMRTVILERNVYGRGKHKFHPMFADFAKHYGFRIRVCKPYRAQTKGKVERFNHYLRYSFHKPLVVQLRLMGIAAVTPELANAEVLRWLDRVANCRLHAEILHRPCDLMQQERDAMGLIPRAYEGILPSRTAAQQQEQSVRSQEKQRIEIPIRDLSLYDRFIPKMAMVTVPLVYLVAHTGGRCA